MGSLGALMLTLSGLSPTIGVFVVGADVIHQAGLASFACYAAAAVLGIAMAFVYAELVSAFPETGAEYTMLGRTLGPVFGFAALGLNLANFTVAQALSGLGVADYLGAIAPGLSPRVVALLLVAAVTGLALFNVRFNAVLTGGFLALEAASLVVVTLLGFGHPHRAVWAAMTGAQPGQHLAVASLAVMGSAAAAAVYAFDGYGGVVSFGEEVREAPRRTPRVVFAALGLAILLQLLPILALMLAAPDAAALSGGAQPVIALVREFGGERLADALGLAVALAIFNAMLALALMAARQLYATGRDRLWPAAISRALTDLHPRFGSPWVATLIMGAVSLTWCFAPLDFLVTVIASVTVVTYGGLCVALLTRRARVAGLYRAPLHPLAPAFALALLLAVVGFSLADAKEGRPGLLAAGAVVVASIVVYVALRWARSPWADRGPGADTDSTPG